MKPEIRLASLQTGFLESFRCACRSLSTKQEHPFVAYLAQQPRLAIQEGLVIYHRGIVERFINTLARYYPVCQKLLGKACFRATMRHFIGQYPCVTDELANYGAELGHFFLHFQPMASLPYLSDMCALEWAYHQAAYAPAPKALQPAILQQAARRPHTLQFQRQPQSTLLTSRYPLWAIWTMNQEQCERPEAGCLTQTIDLQKGGACLFIYTDHNAIPCIESLNQHEYQLLRSLTQPKTLEALLSEPTLATEASLTILEKSVQRSWLKAID